MWKQDIWQEIRQRVSCLDVAPVYGYHPNTGGFILCPFHHEQTGSCKLYPGDGGYHCFGCGAHGDVIDFVSRVAGLSRIDAARELDRQYSLGLEFGPERPGRPKHYDVDGYKRRLDEAIQAVKHMDVPRLLELIRQRRVAYYEEPPGVFTQVVATGDTEHIKRYLMGNVYAVGGPCDYGLKTPQIEPKAPAIQEYHPDAKRASTAIYGPKWDVWLKTIDQHGWTFGEEMDALVDLAERTHTYTPLAQWKRRMDAGELDPGEIGKLTVTILEEFKRLNKPDNAEL